MNPGKVEFISRNLCFPLAVACWIGSPTITSAQSGELVFRTDTVHEIRVTIDRPDWFDAMSQWHESQMDSIQQVQVLFDGVLIDSVGMHMRGNLSYWASFFKKPFKLDINAYIGGQRLDGLPSINLNNDIIDRSHLHTTLAFKLMNGFQVNAPRTGFADLYINDEHFGLYTLVEQVNKTFIEERFGINDGDLWKSYMCYWDYSGEDTSAYADQMELKDSFDGAAFDRLIDLFQLLEVTPDDLLDDSLEAAMDMDLFLRTYAVNASIVAEDNGPHNWWLYWDPFTSRYNYIPWDYDLSFFNVDPATFSLDTITPYWWGSTQLSKAVTRNNDLMDRYHELLCEFRTDHYADGQLTPFIDSIYTLLRPFVLNENTYDNCTISQFDSTYYGLNPQQLISQWGVYAFIEEQGDHIDSALIAFQGCEIPTSVEERSGEIVQIYPNPGSGHFNIRYFGDRPLGFTIHDVLGNEMAGGTLTPMGTSSMDLSDRSSGIYFFRLEDNRPVRIVVTR